MEGSTQPQKGQREGGAALEGKFRVVNKKRASNRSGQKKGKKGGAQEATGKIL